ncbi:MAG: cell division protein SepF, partial [Actinomycetota bacterium]|nr:cell division protein SepF [Actinomycetota bacterium]
MSTLQRLKAYFGMVPAEELDDYDPDYEAGRRADFDRAGYDYDPYASDYEARHGAGYDDEEEADDVRGRSYASEPTGPRRPRREDRDGRARRGRADDGYGEPEVARIRAA